MRGLQLFEALAYLIKIAETSPAAKYAKSMNDARGVKGGTTERERRLRRVVPYAYAPETGRWTRSLANGVRPPAQDQGIPVDPGLTSETFF